MPEDSLDFKELEMEVIDRAREAKEYPFASLQGKLSAEEIKDLKRTAQLERLKRAAFEAGRLVEDIDCKALFLKWPEDKIDRVKHMHRRGQDKRYQPGPREDKKNFANPRYELGKELGSGTFGTAYRGRDLESNLAALSGEDEVVIKIQRSLRVKVPYQEALVLKKVRSRYVVEVHDVNELKHPDGDRELLSRLKVELKTLGCYQLLGEDRPRRVYLVMEFINGPTLEKMITPGGPDDETEAMEWMLQCCKGMNSVHEEGIIHRDLKPENLFIDGEHNRLKIGDFGLAKVSSVENPTPVKPGYETGQKDADVSQFSGAGTPLYMAPEQEIGIAQPESDIYGFGATFYHLLTGRPPFVPKNIPKKKQGEELKRMHREDIPEDPASINPAVSRETSDLIMRCLEKKPQHRYRSFLILRQHLEILPDLKQMIKEGYRHLNEGDFRYARPLFSKATGMWEDSAEAWCGLGEAYLKLGKLKRSIRSLDRAIALKETSSAYAHRGEAHRLAGITSRSIADFQRSEELRGKGGE